jgi:hypothetical protein
MVSSPLDNDCLIKLFLCGDDSFHSFRRINIQLLKIQLTLSFVRSQPEPCFESLHQPIEIKFWRNFHSGPSRFT